MNTKIEGGVSPSGIYPTLSEARGCGACVIFMRRWCERNNFDFKAFSKQQIPIEEFDKINDPYANRFCNYVRLMREGAE